MKLTVLAENTAISKEFGSEHGLCLYLETKRHKLLFDTGASGLFAENAEKLGIDLAAIDLVVISHGHHDHGGGLKTFFEKNGKAKVYLHQKAFERHLASREGGALEEIGLDEALLPNERFVFCGERFTIDEELTLFSGVRAERLVPSGNADLLMQEGDEILRDDFAHEQNLIVREDGKLIVIAGCAHNGIVNILEHFQTEQGRAPDFVIGGFHLYNPNTGEDEKPEVTDEIAVCLLGAPTQYFTCHCTGLGSYRRLKAAMGERIGYLSAGQKITL